jgi:magnesium-protoporphyrin O-methyltransferase
MTCSHCQAAEKIFSRKYVEKELKRYRRKGPRKTTRLLIGALVAEGAEGATLLDIGGGFGTIPYELLGAGISRATISETAAAYLDVAREESERRGLSDRVDARAGDFVEMAGELEPADVVTLDRVICCYPDMESLVGLSVGKAGRLYGVVYPRDAWWTRIGHMTINFGLWIFRERFRIFVHPPKKVDALVREAGFEQRYRETTPNWQVVVYGRSPLRR